MSRIKPILKTIEPQDINNDMVFQFSWDGNMPQGNRLIIHDNISGDMIYEEIDYFTSSLYNRSFNLDDYPTANMVNGGTYSVQIQIKYYGDDGTTIKYSEVSNPIILYCLTEPTFEIDGLINNDESNNIKSLQYTANIKYLQAEGDNLSTYNVNLYNYAKNKIKSSGWKSSTNMSYTFLDLLNNTTYYVQAECESTKGRKCITPLYKLSVNTGLDIKFIMSSENNTNTGVIKVETSLLLLEGKTVDGQNPTYIDNQAIDLTNQAVDFKENEYIKVNDEFAINFQGYDFINNSCIMELNNKELKLFYTEDSFKSTTKDSNGEYTTVTGKARFVLMVGNGSYSYISSPVDTATSSQQYNVFIGASGGKYIVDATLESKNTTISSEEV